MHEPSAENAARTLRTSEAKQSAHVAEVDGNLSVRAECVSMGAVAVVAEAGPGERVCARVRVRACVRVGRGETVWPPTAAADAGWTSVMTGGSRVSAERIDASCASTRALTSTVPASRSAGTSHVSVPESTQAACAQSSSPIATDSAAGAAGPKFCP